MSNLGGDIAWCPVFLPEIKLWQKQLKNTQNQKSLSCNLVQFRSISLLCAKYFVRDCLSKQIYGCNLHQSPSDLYFGTFSVTLKHFYNHNQNMKQVTCVKVPNFLYLVQVKIWLQITFNFADQSFFQRTDIFEPKWVPFLDS